MKPDLEGGSNKTTDAEKSDATKTQSGKNGVIKDSTNGKVTLFKQLLMCFFFL